MTNREAVLGLYEKLAAEFGSLEQAKIEVDRVLCGKSLANFVRLAWHVVEPGQPYVHGWHIDFICAHLEAITNELRLDDGSIYNRLLINIPPGTMKSLLTNVFWPAWEWGPKNKPHMRYVCAAHKVENLSARDSRRMRLLITSEWYQQRWGASVNLAADQNEKLNFQNTAGGFRIATAINSLTGIRGDRVIIDDPHSVDSAASEAMRESETTTFLEAIPTRLNDPIKSSIVVIMQRLHQEDVSGVIIEKELGYDHIMLPMRYDPLRAAPTKLGLEDPRSEEGELLFPQRFPEHVVDRDENAMGPYATASQFQQEPSPRGGGVIKRDWWRLWESDIPPLDFVVASLDTAYTTKQENDPSALTVWGVFSGDVTPMMANNYVGRAGRTGRDMRLKNNEEEAARFDQMSRVANLLPGNPESTPRIMLMYAWTERLELAELVEKVAQTCRRMKVDHLLIENKASGISIGQEIRRLYGHEDWGVQLVNPGSLDKLARLYAVQHLFSEGVIYAPDRRWADQVITQCEVFPKGKHDDLCFVKETMIRMADGTDRPINLVFEGDLVETPEGPRKVLASSFTGIREIWRLEYFGGYLEGTGNHPIMANGEWKPLESLCPYDRLETLSPKDEVSLWRGQQKTGLWSKVLSSTDINTIDIQTQKIQRTEGILRAPVIVCIAMYGSFIKAISQTTIKFITSMVTRPIMTSQTLSVFHSGSIGISTKINTFKWEGLLSNWSIFKKFEKRLPNGTEALKVASGTEKTLMRLSLGRARLSRSAKAIMKVIAYGVDRILKREAQKSFTALHDAQKKNHAMIEVYSVKCTHTMRPVYNLTVEGAHCYYANGVLVHNCDTVSMALKYLRETGILVRQPERIAEIDAGRQHRGKPLEPLYSV